MGEIFPIIMIILFAVTIIVAFALRSHVIKPIEEQDVVTRFKLNLSNSKAKEVALAISNAVEKPNLQVNPQVVEFYEEGTGRLIRIEIS